VNRKIETDRVSGKPYTFILGLNFGTILRMPCRWEGGILINLGALFVKLMFPFVNSGGRNGQKSSWRRSLLEEEKCCLICAQLPVLEAETFVSHWPGLM
jgi:hypothetical protein